MIYDLIILGGGPAGYFAAERAGHAGMSVLCIEERNVGGVCLNEGCIPTKTLLYSAKLYDGVMHGEKYGVTAEGLNIDHAAVIARKDKVVRTLVSGVKSALKNTNVQLLSAKGRITGRNAEGYTVAANDESYTAKRLLIATGSSASVPPIPGLREGLERGFVLTSREILQKKEKPQDMVIIGGGVIGLEFASYFNSIGTKISVIEMLDHIAGENDRDIIKILQKGYEKKGIEFLLSTRVTEVGADFVKYENANGAGVMKAGCVLLSIGRKPNTAGIGLETVNVLTGHGAIMTDEKMKTNQPEIYAAGDVNGKYMLAHAAYREAEVAVNQMLLRHDKMNYQAVPGVIYTNPEIAWVGESEASASSRGVEAVTAIISMRFSGRYLAENEGGDGIFKLVADKKSGVILGAHAICNYCSEFIAQCGTFIEFSLTVEDVKKIIFPHPTVAEIIREAAFQLGNQI